jgi:uroporphyrinogen-III synthase
VAALESGRLDALTFSSAKTVRHTAALLQSAFGEGWSTLLAPQGKRTRPLAVVSIGPQTSKACQALLGRVDAEAQPHDLDGLVAACVLALSPADPD